MPIFKSFKKKKPRKKIPISGKREKMPKWKTPIFENAEKTPKKCPKEKNASLTTIDVVLKNIEHETLFNTLDIVK